MREIIIYAKRTVFLFFSSNVELARISASNGKMVVTADDPDIERALWGYLDEFVKSGELSIPQHRIAQKSGVRTHYATYMPATVENPLFLRTLFRALLSQPSLSLYDYEVRWDWSTWIEKGEGS